MCTHMQAQSAQTDKQIHALRTELDATRRAYEKLHRQTGGHRKAGEHKTLDTDTDTRRHDAATHSTDNNANRLDGPSGPNSPIASREVAKVPRPPSRSTSSSSSLSAFAEEDSRRIAQLRQRLWSSVGAGSPLRVSCGLQAEDLGP